MENQKKFGEIMRDARKKRGLTQDELAKFVGITSVYCRDVEKGKYSATWIIWLKICSVLDIDVVQIAEEYIKPEVSETAGLLGIKNI